MPAAPKPISPTQLNRATLARQLLLVRHQLTPRQAIERLAGMQAQEAKPPFLGLWSRLIGFERERLTKLLRRRLVVRGTLMRATLHLVTDKDFLALRPAVQPALSKAMQSVLRGRCEGFEIDKVCRAAARLLDQGDATFETIRAHLASANAKADARAMGYAVRTHLPLLQVPTDDRWGYPKNPCFTSASSYLDASIDLDEDDATALVRRYLAAFGPASPADAQAWSGLTGLRATFESLRSQLVSFRTEADKELFDLARAPRPEAATPAPVRLLPAFDNLLLAHADRTRILADEHRPLTCSKNLRVHPTFLVDGRIAGLWKIEATKRRATLFLQPFDALPREASTALTAEAEAMLGFAEPEAQIRSVEIKRG